MMLIKCPWCGPRAQDEFICGGEADIVRPVQPELQSDTDWANYLFIRENPRGIHRERWLHLHGCGQWFLIVRHTVTHNIERSMKLHHDGGGLAS